MWTEGYVSGIDYTHGYYPELSPVRLQLSALTAGYDVFQSTPGSVNYLELGFGQGLSVNIHAAATAGKFWATDFNPSHAANAQSMAAASGGELTALDNSFAELAARADLPAFDIIALHGIWSWVSDENRANIADIAKRQLKPGGLFYISYNVTPGWSPAMPLRHLLTQHAERSGQGAIADRINNSLDFAQQVVDAGAAYFKANPAVVERLGKIKDQNRNYLAHEYFNADWHPMPFSQTATLLEAAKLSFATSADLLDQVDAINLSADAQKILGEIPDPMLRETVRDYFVNQQFRRDIFIKGARRLPPLERMRRLQAKAFALLLGPEDRPEKVTGSLGEAALQEAVYKPVFDALASDGQSPKTIAQLHALCEGVDFNQITQALQVLAGSGAVAPAQDKPAIQSARKTTKLLNSELCRRAEASTDVNHLASPVTGAGVQVNRFEQLFLRATELKEKDAPGYVWRVLSAQGESILKDGKALEGEEENLAELRAQHDLFERKRLPVLKSLGIA
ncbi:class I SAM-dependent methyltransferase [Nisaea nitritireducens]|uniref:class I SAM-dependent methyltransferase n=1 Tax=Nisaea nitritireducens TaxID=568392 RepID=UPI0018694CB6|nr:class I SAM-dependent methyltransferase [Nisaea nitritireducens]